MTDDDFISLKQYFGLQHIEETMNERLVSQAVAVKIAHDAVERRLESMNEFRQSLTDQNKTFVSLAEFDAYKTMVRQDLSRLSTDINSLNLSRAELSGKASQGQVLLSMAIGITSLVITIAKLFIK
jgi:hypothetical protein